ncbi:hypothetical protein IWX48DRAFT_604288, partial [Phyllosticta citricarpa]
MSKRTVFTTITPLPAGVSKETVLEFLHDHMSMIDLNPLVVERHMIRPPRSATAEEFHCIWYSLTDRVSYIPGVSGSVTYNACFHDLFDGVQTHVYAPLGLDIKEKWSVGGSLPGEPQAPVELGLNIPSQGLYLREDCDMHCNIVMNKFVKGTLKKAHSVLVDRLVAKAGIEDSKRQSRRVSAMSSAQSSVYADMASSVYRPPSVPSSEAASVSSSSGGGAHSLLSRPSSSQSEQLPPPPPPPQLPPRDSSSVVVANSNPSSANATTHIVAELDSTELAASPEPEGTVELDQTSIEDLLQQKLADDIAAFFNSGGTCGVAPPPPPHPHPHHVPPENNNNPLPPYRPDKYQSFTSAATTTAPAPLKPSYLAYRPPPVKSNSYTAYSPGPKSLTPETAAAAQGNAARPRSHSSLSSADLHLPEKGSGPAIGPVEL